MKYEIPKYLTKQLDAKISLCLSRDDKRKWDRYTKEYKLKLPEELRMSLKEILEKARKQIEDGGTGGT